MHDQPSTGPQQGAADQAQVQGTYRLQRDMHVSWPAGTVAEVLPCNCKPAMQYFHLQLLTMQVQAFSGPSDSSSNNSSTNTGSGGGGGGSTSAPSSVNGDGSGGGGGGGNDGSSSGSSDGSSDGSGSSSSSSFPTSSPSLTSSDSTQPPSSGEGNSPVASDSAATDALVAAPDPGDARRLLRRLSRRLLQ